jgi:7-cyano-7-deazaguanine synthase in queuosine biosynthesis
MKTILLISGGLDSSYLLWKTLSETDDDVTAVFLKYDSTRENCLVYDLREFNSTGTNNICEAQVDQITDWLKANVRDFTYIKHDVDFTKFTPNQTEVPNGVNMYFLYMALEMINANLMDRVLFSYEKENDGFSHGGTVGGAVKLRNPASVPVGQYFVAHATRGTIGFPLIDADYNQAVAFRAIPKNLSDMTRSCDVPVSEPCGVCFKCLKRAMFCEMVEAGQTVEQVQAYIDSKSITEGGKWISMKYWIDPNFQQPYPEWDARTYPSTYTVPDPS